MIQMLSTPKFIQTKDALSSHSRRAGYQNFILQANEFEIRQEPLDASNLRLQAIMLPSFSSRRISWCCCSYYCRPSLELSVLSASICSLVPSFCNNWSTKSALLGEIFLERGVTRKARQLSFTSKMREREIESERARQINVWMESCSLMSMLSQVYART